MTTTFENARVGDKVWHIIRGWGAVESIDERSAYPILVGFDDRRVGCFTFSGKALMVDLKPSLFWDEIKFEVPVQPPRIKLIHGVEVPDISFKPKYNQNYYFPSINNSRHCLLTYHKEGDLHDAFRIQYDLCYPETEEGKQAAILHAKAMLGIKE